MNIFVRLIGAGELSPKPAFSSKKMVVEDNIGESIHIHIRNLRLDFSVRDFIKFANSVEKADKRLNNGDH